MSDDADLPVYTPGTVVRCPKDGDAGCGSDKVAWDGDDGVYDCLDCGQWFGPGAADPPHHREGESV